MKRLVLGKKIGFGFGVVLAIALLLGGVGYWSSARTGAAIHQLGAVQLPTVLAVQKIQECTQRIKVAQRSLLDPSLEEASRARQLEDISKARVEYEPAFKSYEALEKSPQATQSFKQLQAAWAQWRAANNSFMQLAKELGELRVGDPNLLRQNLEIFRGDHSVAEKRVLKMIATKELFAGSEDPAACNFGKWKAALTLQNPELRAKVQQSDATHQQFHATIKLLKELVKANDLAGATALYQKEMGPAAEATLKNLEVMASLAANAQQHLSKMQTQLFELCQPNEAKCTALLDQLVQLSTVEANRVSTESRATVQFTQTLALAMMVGGTALGLLLAYLISRSITTPIRTVVTALSAGAEQTAAAARQVSSASQTLAEGASQQAASLEEVSSSLEEMASRTKGNAEHSHQANELARQTRAAAEKGAADMQAMSGAMQAIKVSSDEIAKIIKTIDEIAFQTNILALNAAVEAARAGESGMGFAVVAEEVRNLAHRSAEAAKETSSKIEGAITKTGLGVELSSKVAQALDQIVTRARQMDELAAEVAGASREQSQGISQVNGAVTQMDKVTQSNAASAEESASAAEELNAQAELMKDVVRDLLYLVDHEGRTQPPTPVAAAPLSGNMALAPCPLKSGAPKQTPAKGASASRTKSAGPGAEASLSSLKERARLELPMDADFQSF